MSLLFPEQIRIGLGATYAVLACVKGKQVTQWHMQEFEPSENVQSSHNASPWQTAVNAISLWLADLAPRGASVSVMLSAELALLHLLPWREDINGSKQQELLAKSHFRRIHNEFSEAWKISITPTGYGAPWLASAIDGALLQSLQQCASSNGATLKSVTPLSIALFNHFRNQLVKSTSWLLVAEPGILVALYVRDKQWQLLQMVPISSLQRESLAQLLLRETRLAGLPDAPAAIYTTNQLAGDEAYNNASLEFTRLNAGLYPALGVAQHSPLHLVGAAA